MRYFILFLSVVVVLASCTKKVTVPTSKQDILIQSKWHLVSIQLTVRDSFGRDSSYVWPIDDCKTDDYLQFKDNFQANHHTGDKKCYNNEASDYGFTWQLTDNGKTLNLYSLDDFFLGSPAVKGDISDLTDSKFTLKTSQYLVGSYPVGDTLKTTKFSFTK